MSNRRSSAFLTRRPLPVAEVQCQDCALWHPGRNTRHVTAGGDAYVLCLDCADRVEAVEAKRPGFHESAGDMLSRLASYYTP